MAVLRGWRDGGGFRHATPPGGSRGATPKSGWRVAAGQKPGRPAGSPVPTATVAKVLSLTQSERSGGNPLDRGWRVAMLRLLGWVRDYRINGGRAV